MFTLILLLIALGGGLLALGVALATRNQSATGGARSGWRGAQSTTASLSAGSTSGRGLAVLSVPALSPHRSRALGVDLPWWRRGVSGVGLLVVTVGLGVTLAFLIGLVLAAAALLLQQAV